MVIRATRVQTTTRRARYVAPAFSAFMGVMFVGYGYFKEGLTGLLLPLGAGFIVYSAVVFIANRRAYGRHDRKDG
jgi:drug/metabolite transporter (DMT)-like permease